MVMFSILYSKMVEHWDCTEMVVTMAMFSVVMSCSLFPSPNPMMVWQVGALVVFSVLYPMMVKLWVCTEKVEW